MPASNCIPEFSRALCESGRCRGLKSALRPGGPLRPGSVDRPVRWRRALSLCFLWLLLPVCLPACHKPTAREIAEQKAIERHEREVAEKKAFIGIIKQLGETKIREAVEFFIGLGREGRLPGIWGNDVHGSLRLPKPPAISPGGPYFISAEVCIVTDSSPPDTYHYVIVEAYTNSAFQLQKAWQTDAAGKLAEEFPIRPAPSRSDSHRIFLGPANSGAESGTAKWYYGVLGSGVVAISAEEVATGVSCFKIGISNPVPGQTHHADFRSEMFSIGNTREQLAFSFAYKLPDKVNAGDDIHVFFRFFDDTGTNFLGQEEVQVGSTTDDSEMAIYKNIARSVVPPRHAAKADISVSANIDGPWTSGMALFDDFCVTTYPGNRWIGLIARSSLGIAAALAFGILLFRRHRSRSAAVTGDNPTAVQGAEQAGAPDSAASSAANPDGCETV